MPRIIIDLGFLKVAVSFIQLRKGGWLYYSGQPERSMALLGASKKGVKLC